jgi:plasmid stabilization system protein ParE
VKEREIRTSRGADREIEAALEWWTRNRPEAPDLLGEELERAIENIISQPRIGSRIKSRRRGEVRRFPLDRTRYSIYYTIADDIPFILSLWHDSRERRPAV